MNITESNKLIAEFMGEIDLKNGRGEWYSENPDALKYTESWDWLMPVVEKIESLDVTVEIEGHNCMISDIKDGGYHQYVAHDSKINAIYVSVVAFIKWYNENKQQ